MVVQSLALANAITYKPSRNTLCATGGLDIEGHERLAAGLEACNLRRQMMDRI
jgi:hypothetical protein